MLHLLRVLVLQHSAAASCFPCSRRSITEQPVPRGASCWRPLQQRLQLQPQATHTAPGSRQGGDIIEAVLRDTIAGSSGRYNQETWLRKLLQAVPRAIHGSPVLSRNATWQLGGNSQRKRKSFLALKLKSLEGSLKPSAPFWGQLLLLCPRVNVDLKNLPSQRNCRSATAATTHIICSSTSPAPAAKGLPVVVLAVHADTRQVGLTTAGTAAAAGAAGAPQVEPLPRSTW